MRMTRFVFPILLLLAPAYAGTLPTFATGAAATAVTLQIQKRDPLTEDESDKLRELAQEPDKRIKLLLKFTQARLATIEQMEGDARLATGRGKQIHDMLEDFTALIDELDDNIDEYA